MNSMHRLFAAVGLGSLLLAAAQSTDDRFIAALRAKSGPELDRIIEAAKQTYTFDLAADATDDDKRKAIWDNAQVERERLAAQQVGEGPTGLEPRPWPGSGSPPSDTTDAVDPAATEAQKRVELAEKLSLKVKRMLDADANVLIATKGAMHAFDKDKDGRLSSEELNPLVASINTKAESAGVDGVSAEKAFKDMDSDGSGFVEGAELLTYLEKKGVKKRSTAGTAEARERRANSEASSDAEAAGEGQDLGSRFFEKMDRDKDEKLSKEEMQHVLEATEAQAKQKGESATGDALFRDLDANDDGFIDREEAAAFFREMNRAGLLAEAQKGRVKEEL